jgi:hypothetical protein
LAIKSASLNGHLAVVDRLLQDERVDPAADDNNAIKSASRNGHLAVVDRLLQDERVDPAADDSEAIRWASRNGYSAIIKRLLQDERVDPTSLHQPPPYKQCHVSVLTDAMLPRLALTLSLPFPTDSQILLWQPRLREYRRRQIAFLEALIANWLAHGDSGGLSREIIEDIVCEYLLGMQLRQFCALDAEYVAPPPLDVGDEAGDGNCDADVGETC